MDCFHMHAALYWRGAAPADQYSPAMPHLGELRVQGTIHGHRGGSVCCSTVWPHQTTRDPQQRGSRGAGSEPAAGLSYFKIQMSARLPQRCAFVQIKPAKLIERIRGVDFVADEPHLLLQASREARRESTAAAKQRKPAAMAATAGSEEEVAAAAEAEARQERNRQRRCAPSHALPLDGVEAIGCEC